MSQKEAAVMGVRSVGLNLVKPLPGNLPVFFMNLNRLFGTRLDHMFSRRLDLLIQASRDREGKHVC